MNKRLLSLLTLAAFTATAAACGDNAGGDGDVISQDTAATTITGTDTMNMPVEVQTQDTVLQTTTTTVDTVEGGVVDTAATTRP